MLIVSMVTIAKIVHQIKVRRELMIIIILVGS